MEGVSIRKHRETAEGPPFLEAGSILFRGSVGGALPPVRRYGRRLRTDVR